MQLDICTTFVVSEYAIAIKDQKGTRRAPTPTNVVLFFPLRSSGSNTRLLGDLAYLAIGP